MGKIIQISVSDVFTTNAYLYYDERTMDGFLIDPGAEADRLLAMMEDLEVKVQRILLTHGHFDHTGAVKEVSETLGIPYCIHEEGLCYLEDQYLNLSANCERRVVLKKAESFADGDRFALGDGSSVLKVIHAPGHTPDSCILYSEEDDAAFVGDTIFKGSIGATHYPGGDSAALNHSIFSKVLALPPRTILLSGHSEPTTVAAERARYGL